MNFKYHCKECGLVNTVNIRVANQPEDWSPPATVDCSTCKAKASRVFGASIGVQENRDQTKHIGESLSSQRGIQFVGKDFPDVERKLDAEEKEIAEIMDEPVTAHDIQSGYDQMAQLEEERGKPKGFYSGKREEVEVEADFDGKIVKKKSAKKRGAAVLKKEAQEAKAVRGA